MLALHGLCSSVVMLIAPHVSQQNKALDMKLIMFLQVNPDIVVMLL